MYREGLCLVECFPGKLNNIHKSSQVLWDFGQGAVVKATRSCVFTILYKYMLNVLKNQV